MIILVFIKFDTPIRVPLLFLSTDLEAWAIWLNIVLVALCHTFFLVVACKNPGYLKNENIDFGAMLLSIDSTQLCPDC